MDRGGMPLPSQSPRHPDFGSIMTLFVLEILTVTLSCARNLWLLGLAGLPKLLPRTSPRPSINWCMVRVVLLVTKARASGFCSLQVTFENSSKEHACGGLLSQILQSLRAGRRIHQEGATNAPWDCQVDAPGPGSCHGGGGRCSGLRLDGLSKGGISCEWRIWVWELRKDCRFQGNCDLAATIGHFNDTTPRSDELSVATVSHALSCAFKSAMSLLHHWRSLLRCFFAGMVLH